MPTFDAVILLFLLFVSTSLLLGARKRDSSHDRGLQQRSLLAGLVGISYVASKSFWLFCGGYLHSSVAALSFYVGYHVLGGMVMAVMLSVVMKRTKTLFTLSMAVFVALIFFAFFFERRYRIRLLLSADAAGFFVGGLMCWVMDLINKGMEQVTQVSKDQPGAV